MAAEDLRGFFNNEGSEEEEDDIHPPTPLPFTPRQEAPLPHHHHQRCPRHHRQQYPCRHHQQQYTPAATTSSNTPAATTTSCTPAGTTATCAPSLACMATATLAEPSMAGRPGRRTSPQETRARARTNRYKYY